jgi:hypothetical protein
MNAHIQSLGCAALDRLADFVFVARFRMTQVELSALVPMEPAPRFDDRPPDPALPPIEDTLRAKAFWGDELD